MTCACGIEASSIRYGSPVCSYRCEADMLSLRIERALRALHSFAVAPNADMQYDAIMLAIDVLAGARCPESDLAGLAKREG